MTIGPLDDLPVHQTAETVHAPIPRRDHGERYLFTGYRPEDRLLFAATLGIWPGRRVVDAAFSVSTGGVQWTTAASAEPTPVDRSIHVGPIRLDVLEPLGLFELIVTDESGLFAAELRFRTAGLPDGERIHPRATPDGDEDVTRFTQLGSWSGRLHLEGRSVDLAAPGSRRRTWGDQPIGERPERGRPLSTLPHRVDFDLRLLSEDHPWANHTRLGPDGAPTYEHGCLRRVELTRVPGTRWPRHVSYATGDGARVELEVTDRLLLSDLGSLDPRWSEGAWKGADARRTVRRTQAEVDAGALTAVHTLGAGDVTLDGESCGPGLLDACLLGPCAPLGVAGWTDAR